MVWPEFGRYGRVWSPWREMERLQQDMNRLLSRESTPYSTTFPAVNIWASDQDVIVTAEVPGVAPENLDITVAENVLKLTGSRKPEELKPGEVVLDLGSGGGLDCFLAAKNVLFPDRDEIASIEYYLEHFIWGKLQRRDDETPYPYGIYGTFDNWYQHRTIDPTPPPAPGDECDASLCGPRPRTVTLMCSDGSLGGNTGRCFRGDHRAGGGPRRAEHAAGD